MNSGRSLVGALTAILALSGCIELRIDFQDTPPLESVRAIEPGVSTRADVLRVLGPPDEVSGPALGEELRRLDSRAARVLIANDIFGDGAWTWAMERRSERVFGLLPIGPALFRVRHSQSSERRWRIEFDERGVVRSVARAGDIPSP